MSTWIVLIPGEPFDDAIFSTPSANYTDELKDILRLFEVAGAHVHDARVSFVITYIGLRTPLLLDGEHDVFILFSPSFVFWKCGSLLRRSCHLYLFQLTSHSNAGLANLIYSHYDS